MLEVQQHTSTATAMTEHSWDGVYGNIHMQPVTGDVMLLLLQYCSAAMLSPPPVQGMIQ
jgi:hypothetical protein